MSAVLRSLNSSSVLSSSNMNTIVTSINKWELPPTHPSSLGAGVEAVLGLLSSQDHPVEPLTRRMSTTSCHDSDDEEDASAALASAKSECFVAGPLLPLKQQLEKDSEDESLRRWKEQLLGSIQLEAMQDAADPEVKVQTVSIVSPGRQDMVINLPSSSSYKTRLFTLKEGSLYRLKFTFSVHGNIVSGLTYIHTVWKNGIRVDSNHVMLGTFPPRQDAHVVLLEEEMTPSGYLARGNYTAKTRFVDDDGRRHFEMEHTFDIRREW